MKQDEHWRLFIAIEIPRDTRRRVMQHVATLREQAPDVRATWNREENVHLTLKFLGDVATDRVEALSQAAARSAQKVAAFSLSIEGCGAFPSPGKPKVLWIGIGDPTGGLHRLSGVLEDECDRAGFAREPRGFNPHLTIARLRRPQGARRLAELHQQIGFPKTDFVAGDLSLIRSERSSSGSRYTVLARHTFAPG
jgi:2'-5' RNA ligase